VDDDSVDHRVGPAITDLSLELLGPALEIAQLAQVRQLDRQVSDLELPRIALGVLSEVVEIVDEPVLLDRAGRWDLDGVGDVGDEVDMVAWRGPRGGFAKVLGGTIQNRSKIDPSQEIALRG